MLHLPPRAMTLDTEETPDYWQTFIFAIGSYDYECGCLGTGKLNFLK